MSTAEAQLKSEIARLTASINFAKSTSTSSASYPKRSNVYVNPNYQPPAYKQPRNTVPLSRPTPPVPQTSSSTAVKDVVLNGVAFESSGRSLVRKDLPKPNVTAVKPTVPYARKSGHLIPDNRTYKSRSTRGRRRGRGNMTLTNNRRPYQDRLAAKRSKYMNKPCPRFTTTGACSRGLTCMYQHDPTKIAICWNFLQGTCNKTADTCNLSHDPTPERTPLCLHFSNKGRCTRLNCPFPHVNMGARDGICRDFAVLGYCENGLNCEKQHVRECPDFAERGTCSTKGCKLPHVIRANRNRPPTSVSEPHPTSANPESAPETTVSAEDAKIGDEYISLTFHESDSSEGESDEEEAEDADDNDEEVDASDTDTEVAVHS